MLLELRLKVSNLGLEVSNLGLQGLHLGEEEQHDRPDGGRSRLPICWRNSKWRRKLVHREKMMQCSRIVKPLISHTQTTLRGPERLR